jgi:hypothetical protein
VEVGPSSRRRFTFRPITQKAATGLANKLDLAVDKKFRVKYENIGAKCQPGVGPSARLPILKDGNCFYNAISLILTGSQGHHNFIRQTVCSEIESNPTEYAAFMDDVFQKDPVNYITNSKQRSMGVFATQVEMMATARVFGRDVICYYDKRWLRYSFLPKMTRQCFYLVNENTHYEVVTSV